MMNDWQVKAAEAKLIDIFEQYTGLKTKVLATESRPFEQFEPLANWIYWDNLDGLLENFADYEGIHIFLCHTRFTFGRHWQLSMLPTDYLELRKKGLRKESQMYNKRLKERLIAEFQRGLISPGKDPWYIELWEEAQRRNSGIT
jgi:hypothetical protein